ncbi:type VI secretion system lipoprotein TssJ [bacterium SGD-2]|nr:type VI secretion system lipoprotein TssJ [bacterium SGD-2]
MQAMRSSLLHRIGRLCVRLASAGALCIAVAACSTVNSMFGGNSEKDALREMKWAYAPDGLQIMVEADPMLNEANGQPHMLAVVVVQLEAPNAFTSLTADSEKLKSLLLAPGPAQGMLSLDRVFIAPGERRALTLPRVEKAQYVGLAAGYNHLDPARSTRLYQIGVSVDSSGLIIKTRTAHPDALAIDLHLGPESIQGAPGTKPLPVDPVRPRGGPYPPDEPSSNTASRRT